MDSETKPKEVASKDPFASLYPRFWDDGKDQSDGQAYADWLDALAFNTPMDRMRQPL
ncbi:MAG TPA: hypothetical protein VG984_00905 [Candidatus Paceibacterota bacterium]|nr:hypothetical protein [Candidatus Paceibacterota bacterium]